VSWLLTFDGYDPADEKRREALCTVGNGYLATRGAWRGCPAGDVHAPGTYLAGCYDRLRDERDGVVLENESLVNLPDWLPLSVAVGDGDWLGPETAELLAHQLELDLRRGVLTRRFRIRAAGGEVVTGVERRFVSMDSPHLAGLSLAVVVEGWSGRLRVRSAIDGTVTNSGVERYRALASQHLTDVSAEALPDGVALVTAATAQSRIRIAVATRTTADRPGEWRTGPDASHELVLDVRAGDVVAVQKTAAVFSSRDAAISEPATAAGEALVAADFEEALGRHVLAWSRLWRRFDVDLAGSVDSTLAAVRLNTFHLLQSVSPHTADVDAGVPARGLHGEAYRGHIFWDELFVFPVLTLRLPALTRALLLYRCRRLPAARRAAQEAGHAGAMYPWQSGSDGREESQRLHLNPLSGRWLPDATNLQRHVGLAVAYTMWQYVQATGDTDFLADHAAEVIIEVARFFASLASYDDGRDRFVIRGVVGPDEFHTGYPDAPYDGIDDNAYTNVMVSWLLRRAAEALEMLPPTRRTELTESLGLRPEELDRWALLARRLHVPFHDGVISQFDGYDKLAELDWEHYRREYGDIRRLDRILEAQGLSVMDYRVSKQADVLMLLYLLPPGELCELLRGLGYDADSDLLKRTVRYYLDRTSHGSTLSALVHAWGLASLDRGEALRFLDQTLRSDSGEAGMHGGTTAEGIHLAAMAGSIDLLQRCFTGLSIDADDALRFAPSWPRELGELRMTLRYRRHQLAVRISDDSVRVTSEPCRADPIRVALRDRSVLLHPGDTVAFSNGG
jgi:alpha,alpha-trehalase